MRVKVVDVDGTQASTPQGGEKLYALIAPVLATGETVTLDFEGVKHCSVPFFTASIGVLVEADAEGRLPALLHYENLPPLGQGIVDDVTEYAIRRRENPKWAQGMDESAKRLFARE
jgi:hypothetical protein